MYLLGISGHHHGGAAALLRDGQVLAAIEEEKLARVRHLGLRQSGGLPHRAIGFCLDRAGIGLEAIDAAIYDVQPRALLRRSIEIGERKSLADASLLVEQSQAGVHEFRDRMRTLHRLRQLLGRKAKVLSVDHQLAHAASAYYPSGFDRAALLVLNGRADFVPVALGEGEGAKIRIRERLLFPHSLGWLYEQITRTLGFGQTGEEGKTQWLSLDGEPEFLASFQDLLRIDKRGFPRVNSAYFDFSHPRTDSFSELFYRKFGNHLKSRHQELRHWDRGASLQEAIHRRLGYEAPPRPKEISTEMARYRRNMACSLQQHLEAVVLAMAEALRKQTGADALCVAGGVALNSLLVSRLERDAGFRRVFVQPAAGNAGCSLGGPLYYYHRRSGKPAAEPWRHLFFGPQYSDEDVKTVLENCRLPYSYFNSVDKLNQEVAGLLQEGKIVAWFQGPAEFGGRSLGGRSILASPLQEYVKENLNVYIKHREVYRPFAVSVLEEHAADYFEDCRPMAQFLMNVSRIRPEQRERLGATWFADGLVRAHLVSRQSNPVFWKLLDAFGRRSGVPMLINTSFNLFGEPLVCSPRDAVRSFYCSGLDALALNRFLLQKNADTLS